MNIYYCPVQTHAGSINYGPPEWCSNEVENEGDLCPQHDEDDRSDELYEQYLESKYEENLDPWGDE